MSDPIDLPSLDGLSKNETVKATSNHLRGLIKEERLEDAPASRAETVDSIGWRIWRDPLTHWWC